MEYKSLKKRKGLEKELVTLKRNPNIQLPSILKLVEFEVTQLKEILQTMGKEDIHEDVDGLEMIDRISNEFGLTDASSANLLSNALLRELETMNLCFNPQLIYTAKSILMAANRLNQRVSRELMAHMHNAGGSTKLARENIELSINVAIATAMDANPQDFCVNKVLELLEQGSIFFSIVDINNEEVRKLIIQKCNEAIERRDKGLADLGDHGKSDSQQD